MYNGQIAGVASDGELQRLKAEALRRAGMTAAGDFVRAEPDAPPSNGEPRRTERRAQPVRGETDTIARQRKLLLYGLLQLLLAGESDTEQRELLCRLMARLDL